MGGESYKESRGLGVGSSGFGAEAGLGQAPPARASIGMSSIGCPRSGRAQSVGAQRASLRADWVRAGAPPARPPARPPRGPPARPPAHPPARPPAGPPARPSAPSPMRPSSSFNPRSHVQPWRLKSTTSCRFPGPRSRSPSVPCGKLPGARRYKRRARNSRATTSLADCTPVCSCPRSALFLSPSSSDSFLLACLPVRHSPSSR